MHILMVIHSLEGGGAERSASIMSGLWSKSGHRVSLVTLTPPDIAPAYNVNPTIELIALGVAEQSANLAMKVKNNIRRVTAIRRTIRSRRPDVVISFIDTTNVLVGFACLGLHVPALALERVHPPYQEWSSPRQFVRSFAYGVFNCIVAQTDLTATWIRQHTFARDVRVIANICEYPLSSGEPNIDPDGIVDPNKRVILSAGRLINQKGHSYLIDAFAEVASEFREWDLVILGDGPLLENLADHVKVLNLQSRVHLPGRVGNVGDWYNRSSIFVLTSLFEGFPNVLLEAMAYGLPVISFDCDTGPSVLIRDCENGFLVPTTDVKALTTRLKELLRSEALRQQLGTSARAVRERFSPHCIMKQWQSLLTEICH